MRPPRNRVACVGGDELEVRGELRVGGGEAGRDEEAGARCRERRRQADELADEVLLGSADLSRPAPQQVHPDTHRPPWFQKLGNNRVRLASGGQFGARTDFRRSRIGTVRPIRAGSSYTARCPRDRILDRSARRRHRRRRIPRPARRRRAEVCRCRAGRHPQCRLRPHRARRGRRHDRRPPPDAGRSTSPPGSVGSATTRPNRRRCTSPTC